MVDVDDDVSLEQALVGQARLLGAVDGHEHAARGDRRERLAQEAVLGQRRGTPYSAGRGASPTSTMTLSFPSARERQVHREQRPERVPVRILVRGDEEPVVLRERCDDGGHVSRLGHRRLRSGRDRDRRSASSSGRRARPTDRMRRASCGVRRSRSSRLIRPCRIPAAPSSAVRVACRCFSPPYTLSQTVAWARSEVVTTPVTVTKPMRGSFSVGIVSETIALIASSTRASAATARGA